MQPFLGSLKGVRIEMIYAGLFVASRLPDVGCFVFAAPVPRAGR